MSTDSHDRTKTPCKISGRGEVEENMFDGKRIKKEHSDISVENGDAAVTAATAAAVEKGQLPAGRFTSNGFHGDGDLLQDLIATKFTTLANHSASSKQDKIRIMIEDGISEESRTRVDEIFSQVEQLKLEEKLLLYLKFPLLLTNPSGTIDPLRQPLNPLGNRYEIHQTIMWIKTHLEEDPDVSLPKQEVYDEYNIYCIRNSMKPLSTADFGKVMKQVYPRVRPRRLGTRGNSRYCYAGMRKRIKLDPPTLPKISGPQTGEHSEENITEEMLGASSTLIREWAENILGLKFPNLSALARHLVDNFRVDTRSLAAVCILATSDERNALSNKQAISDLSTMPVSAKPAKLREAQLQLQRKLQQREHIKDQKRRHHLDTIIQNKEKVIEGKGNISKGYKKVKSNLSPQGTNTAATTVIAQNSLAKLNLSAVVYNRQKRVSKTCNQQQQQQSCNVSEESNCDNLVISREDKQSNRPNPRIMMSVQRDMKNKNSRKRANNPLVTQQEPSPEKQTKLAEESSKHSNVLLPKLASIQRTGKISVILASNSKSIKCKAIEAADSQLAKNCDIDSSSCSITGALETSSGLLTKDQICLLQDTPVLKNEKVRDIDTDALDDYLNGGNNSQEQEEELLQYFQQSNSSSSDVETGVVGSDAEQISRSDKVSQLRLILQQNLKASTIATDVAPATTIIRQSVAAEKRDPSQKYNNNLILSTLLNHNLSNTRRRVSFETNVVEHTQETATPSVANTVPQSPNTRRRIFNFTPISPGPHSPINGRASKSNSANASPFVSPRNTPVPRSRSNLQASTSRSRQKTLSRSISCSVPYTIKTTDTFIVPTSSGAESTRHVLTIATTDSSEVVLKGSSCAAFLDLTPQKQLLINYPSQENLQEIKNVYQKGQPPPPDQEITELLHAGRHLNNEQLFYRSQSVPLHRMVNPVQSVISPISTQHSLSTVQSQSFNPSTSSSVAPTPVPSEYNDFGPSIGQESTYLLDDTNFMSDEQQFLMTDKGITSENINNILTILDEEDQPNLQMLPEQTTEETLNNAINLALPNTNLNLSQEDMLDPSSILNDAGSALQKIIQSRSYPNTPLPAPVSAYTPSYIEDSNGSRSYPSTPLHTIQSQEVYQDSGEPMLSSPILNSLNLQSDTINVAVATVTGATAGTNVDTAATASSNNLCRNVADFLEASFLGETDTETDDLDPLGNFDGLQDMDSLTPLFNEVAEPNR